MMTDGFKVGKGLEKGDGLGPILFNIALEYVTKQMSVEVTCYKSVQLVDYADDVNITGGMKSAASEVYEELKERAKGIGLNIRV
jgi:hypothetical protein